MSGRPTQGVGWLWALAYGTITVGAFSVDVAVTAALDGAATPSEQQLLWGATVLALVSLSLAVAFVTSFRLASSVLHLRRQLASATVCVAGVIGVGRVTLLGGRLAHHVRLDLDEPLTTVSLSLQIAVAVTAAAAVVAFASHEARVVGRLIAVGDDARRRTPASTDVGRSGRCPTN